MIEIIRKIKKIFIAVFAFVFIGLFANGQDFKNDFNKMNSAYSSIENLHAEADILIYGSYNDVNPDIRKKSVVKKLNELYYIFVDGVHMLYSDSLVIIANDEDKTITPVKRSKNDNISAMEMVSENLPDFYKNVDSIVYNGIKDDCLHYTIYAGLQTIVQTELFIDKTTFLIKKLIYLYNTEYYKQDNKVEIKYSVLDINPSIKRSDFSEKLFVSFSKGKYFPSMKYSNYIIIN